MENDALSIQDNLSQMKRDIELIKNILISEGELTDWAEKELDKARQLPESQYISHGEVKKSFFHNEVSD